MAYYQMTYRDSTMATDNLVGGKRDNTGKPRYSYILDFLISDLDGLVKTHKGAQLLLHIQNGYVEGLINIRDVLISLHEESPEQIFEGVHRVSEFGRTKYAPRNWKKGLAVSEIYNSALRHLLALDRGEALCPDSGLPHTAHLMWNCLEANWMAANRPEWDDRDKEIVRS